MNLPQLPKGPLVDKNGNITIPWLRWFYNQVANTNHYLSDDGYKMPVITKSIQALKQDGVNNIGTFFYLRSADAANDEVIVNLNGNFKKFTLTDVTI